MQPTNIQLPKILSSQPSITTSDSTYSLGRKINTSNVSTSIATYETTKPTEEGLTTIASKHLTSPLNNVANETISIKNIPINIEEYKLVLHFKNGGLINQLNFDQLKILSKFYQFTEKDIIALQDKTEFIECFRKKNKLYIEKAARTNPTLAKKLFEYGHYSIIEYIPKELQTKEICNKAFNHSESNFIYLNDEFKTFAMCKQYLENSFDINFALIPKKFRIELQTKLIDKIRKSSFIHVDGIELLPLDTLKQNLNIVKKACLQNSSLLPKLDPCFATSDFIEELAKQSILHVPEQYLNIDLILLAIKHSGFYSDKNYSREDKLKIIDKYFMSHREEIQTAVHQRFKANKAYPPTFLLKYMPDYLSEEECISYLKKDIENYKELPEIYKSNATIIKYVLDFWLIVPNYSYLSQDIVQDILLNYKDLPGVFPDYFFTKDKNLKHESYIKQKNFFLKSIPHEYKNHDMWFYICTNIDRAYINKIPETTMNEQLLMLLVDEYVQDDSRFDIDFTETLFAHRLFNFEIKEKLLVHSVKCSARSSNVFIKILTSTNIPQEFKDNIFNGIMQGNIGYPKLNVAALYAKTNPLQSQVPANSAANLLATLYKCSSHNMLVSTKAIDELKSYMEDKKVELLPLDRTDHIFTNAKIAGGRTIQVNIDENTAIFYKFRKPNERLEDFVKEGYFLEFLNENNMGRQIKDKLKSDIPTLHKIVRIPVDNLPKYFSKCEDGLDKYFDHNNILCVDTLIFKCSRDYLQYAHKPNIDNPENQFIKPEQGMLKACHDLGVFMSQGIYHTTTLPLFHLEEDYRKWSVLNMILRGLPEYTIRGICDGYFYLNQHLFSMTGKLEAWDTTATERPDYGYSGLRDLADYEFYGEIKSTAERNDSQAELFETIKQKAYAANAISECFMAIILLYARLNKFSDDYHYTNNDLRNKTIHFIENMFTSFLVGMLQDETINLQTFMELSSEDYQNWLDRAVTELVYWTAKQPELTPEEYAKAENNKTNDCFSVHVNNQKLPESLFDTTTVPKSTKYPKKFTTSYMEKQHNNLGMYNGTFPLLSLINFVIVFNTKLIEYKARR